MSAELRRHFFDASGGLVYHWRAWRYRRTLWQPFVAQVAHWLAGWQVPQDELVIVGPSAGYTLDAAFLARFARIIVLEPDTFAKSRLRRRFSGISFEEGRVDCFSGQHGPSALVEAYPQAAILFSNSIGQQLAQLDPAWPEALKAALVGHSWASYHDVVASAQAPAKTQAQSFDSGARLEEVLAGFWSGGELIVHDHGSFDCLPVQAYATWSLTPQQHHLVGWWSSITVSGSSNGY